MKELSNQKTEIFEAYKAERSAARQSERAFYEWRDNVRDLEREAWRIEQNRRIEDMFVAWNHLFCADGDAILSASHCSLPLLCLPACGRCFS